MTPRGVDVPAVGVASAAGAAVLAGCVLAAGDGPPYAWLQLALVPLAAAAALVLDEPAAAAADAAPSSRRRRTVGRLPVLAVPLGVWAAGVAAVAARAPGTAVGALLATGGGVLALTVGAAAVLRRTGRAEPGEPVAAAAGVLLLGLLVLGPGWVPVPPDGLAPWAGAAVAGALLVALAPADPAVRLSRRGGRSRRGRAARGRPAPAARPPSPAPAGRGGARRGRPARPRTPPAPPAPARRRGGRSPAG